MPSTASKSRRTRGEKRINHLTPAAAVADGVSYVVLPGQALKDLGPYGIKVLSTLLNRSADFRWSRWLLQKTTQLTEHKLRAGISEVRKAGYARTKTMGGRGGQLNGQLWEVATTPFVWPSETGSSAPSHRVVKNRHDGIHQDKSIIYHNVTTPLPSPCRRGESESFAPEALTRDSLVTESLAVFPETPDTVLGDNPEDGVTDISEDILNPLPVEEPQDEPDNEPKTCDISTALPECLRPSRSWGHDTRGAFDWVRNSQFAEEFRKILGDGFVWDLRSARSFYRRFRSGAIQPMDIYAMQKLGREEIRQAVPVAVTSLEALCRQWERVINTMGKGEGNLWSFNRREVLNSISLNLRFVPLDFGYQSCRDAGGSLVDLVPLGTSLMFSVLEALEDSSPDWLREQLEALRLLRGKDFLQALEVVSPVQALHLMNPDCSSEGVIALARAHVFPRLVKMCAAAEERDATKFEMLVGVIQTIESY